VPQVPALAIPMMPLENRRKSLVIEAPSTRTSIFGDRVFGIALRVVARRSGEIIVILMSYSHINYRQNYEISKILK
jgi:exosortase/archaeosortase